VDSWNEPKEAGKYVNIWLSNMYGRKWYTGGKMQICAEKHKMQKASVARSEKKK